MIANVDSADDLLTPIRRRKQPHPDETGSNILDDVTPQERDPIRVVFSIANLCHNATMNHVFIGGPPTSGKSFLADSLAREFGLFCIGTDKLRKTVVAEYPQLKPWKDYFCNQPADYWETLTPERYLEDCRKQTEAFWEKIKEEIDVIATGHPAVIFEGIDFLPHLAARDIKFSGVFLLCPSFNIAYERNALHPRLGQLR